jgi:C4-type Zn-finger protein
MNGYVVAHVRCRRCGHEHISVHPVEAPEDRLECSKCGAQDSLTRRIPKCQRGYHRETAGGRWGRWA